MTITQAVNAIESRFAPTGVLSREEESFLYCCLLDLTCDKRDRVLQIAKRVLPIVEYEKLFMALFPESDPRVTPAARFRQIEAGLQTLEDD